MLLLMAFYHTFLLSYQLCYEQNSLKFQNNTQVEILSAIFLQVFSVYHKEVIKLKLITVH